MVKPGASTLVLVLILALAAGPAFGTKEDGLPRPTGYPDTPTTDYGPLPPCYEAGVAVTCNWYGFSHILYPTLGASCNAGMRRALSNTTLFGPGDLSPYTYYYSRFYVFDPATNDTYCLYGCFDMSSTSTAPPPLSLYPPPALASPPAVSSPPPPVILSSPPPPVLLSSPPPPVLLSSPPPATLFTPPPSSLTTPSPPAGTAPSPPAGTPPSTGVFSLNGAGFLRPTGFVSFVLSGALLILNGLAAF